MDRITNNYISELKEKEVFVFGSNEAGKHGAGAARLALKWGAKYGVYAGIHGMTYAIPTKDKNIKTLPLTEIKVYVDEFIRFAISNYDLKFFVTEIGCGLAGYEPEDIAPMFKDAIKLKNVYLPERFWEVLRRGDNVKS